MVDEEKLKELREEFIRISEDLTEFRGQEKISGRIVGLILSSPEPMTQDELADATGYSQSQISRYLKSMVAGMLITSRNLPQKEIEKRKNQRKPPYGKRTQFYEAKEKSFLDTYKQAFSKYGSVLHEKIGVIKYLLDEWDNLDEKSKKSKLGVKLWEVLSVFYATFEVLVEVFDEINEKYDKKIEELQRKLLKRKI